MDFNFTFWFQFFKIHSNQLVFFFIFVVFEILFHSIHVTAFYLFHDRSKIICFFCYIDSIGWMISDAISCVCSMLIRLFDDSFWSFCCCSCCSVWSLRLWQNEIWGNQEIDVTSVKLTQVTDIKFCSNHDKSSFKWVRMPTRIRWPRSIQRPKERETETKHIQSLKIHWTTASSRKTNRKKK